MALQGTYSLQDALNRALPVFKRLGMGDLIANLITFVNAAAAQNDVQIAIDAALVTYGSGTLTVGGSIAAGNAFSVTFVNASIPSLVSPGVTVGPIPVVTGDTTTTLATKLTTAINLNAALLGLAWAASSSGAVVTVKTVGTVGNSTTMTATIASGGVVTVTPVNPSGGTGAATSRNASVFGITTLAARN